MFEPTFLTESKVTLGTNDFEEEVSGFKLTPSYATATFKGLKRGSSHTRSGLATWVLTINFGQDHESATSLSTYLLEHEGEKLPYSVEPLDGGTAFSGELIAQAGEIGGDVDQFGQASVTLPVLGTPERTPVAAAG
jgi:hypothetical protein